MGAKPIDLLVIAVSVVYVSLSAQCAGKQVQGNDQSQAIANDTPHGNMGNKDTFHLQSEKLRLVIANNEAYGPVHAAGYSGVSKLYLKSENEKNLFTSRAGGLNFEFIFSGDSSSYEWNKFEPRRSRMDIERVSSSKIRLRQSRTSNWPLNSEITYSLVGDAIDFEYRGTPLIDLWKKHG